jgi:glycosyltransferase involved in cell wall biosynthesis
VHLHFPNPMGEVSYLLRARRVALVVSYHADIIRQRALVPLYQPVLHALLTRADRVIAGAPEYIASSTLLTRYRAKCVVIPYGVHPAALALRDGESREVEAVRAHYGTPLVLFVGVLRPYKGVDVLIEAMGGGPGRALVVGHGPERSRLQARARDLRLEDRIAFLGEVSPARLRVLLHAADVFVLPSIDRREAFGIAQLEAMACGKPAVASDLPTGIRSVNRHNETGLLVKPRDPAALRAAVNRLLEDPGLAARLGQAAQAQVQRDFTAKRMVERVLTLYGDTLRE